ncbi:MAG TPA: beta-ketoacyl-[acyl-carrier-protein] synthase family protein [Pirellulales bacterium]|nr:beta-ketoacyl-[acyl-carrier-protein] synthase family protein [Pirellulales bacterium]
MRRRVVITGAGCVTPLGAEVATVWRRLTEGESGVRPLSLFDASHYPVRIAAEVRDWDMATVGEDPARWRFHPRQTQFAVASALQAMASAELRESQVSPLRLGVYLGCGETFQDFEQFARLVNGSAEAEASLPSQFSADALRLWRPHEEAGLELNMPATFLAGFFNAQGPNANCIAACASSTQAIGEAAQLIREGTADVMLAGGAHSMVHPFGISGFHRLSALSQRNDDPAHASRPFDRQRDGFVVGEGGAIVVLEDLEHALRRKADIWGELTGYGSAQDAYRVTDAHPEGRGAATCMARALDHARLDVDQIHYINAHGTGTVLNDKIETLAIKQVFGEQAYRVPISSTKSMLGHFTTAGGAMELVISLLALRTGILPPTMNLDTADPDCDLDYIPNEAREAPIQHVLSNSFGFGGQNAALVVSRYDERSSGKQITRRAA